MSEIVPLDMCTQPRFRSACAFAVWSDFLLGTFWIAKAANSLNEDNEDWSDCTVVQAELSLC